MKKALLSVAALLGVASSALADEGMWILSLLSKHNIDVMKQEGCRLTPEQIYSVNNGSIKDAVIIFGGGCTGEITIADTLPFRNSLPLSITIYATASGRAPLARICLSTVFKCVSLSLLMMSPRRS